MQLCAEGLLIKVLFLVQSTASRIGHTKSLLLRSLCLHFDLFLKFGQYHTSGKSLQSAFMYRLYALELLLNIFFLIAYMYM